MSTRLTGLTIAGALDGLAKKEFSAVELAHAHLKAMEKHRDLNAFITETPDKALAMAKASDERRAKGEVGPLEGIPLAIKDLFCTEGVQTTAGSQILEGFKPPYESTVTANLWKAGAVMLGKINMDEFAMGSSAISRRISAASAIRGGGNGRQPARWCRAAPRAARPRRSRRASRLARPAPTPAARSASRPPSPASSASSRPTAAARAGASSPSPRRSTRPGRWRARRGLRR